MFRFYVGDVNILRGYKNRMLYIKFTFASVLVELYFEKSYSSRFIPKKNFVIWLFLVRITFILFNLSHSLSHNICCRYLLALPNFNASNVAVLLLRSRPLLPLIATLRIIDINITLVRLYFNLLRM